MKTIATELSVQEIFEELIKKKEVIVRFPADMLLGQATLERERILNNLNVIKSRASTLYKEAGFDWNNFVIRIDINYPDMNHKYLSLHIYQENPQPIKRYKVTIIG